MWREFKSYVKLFVFFIQWPLLYPIILFCQTVLINSIDAIKYSWC